MKAIKYVIICILVLLLGSTGTVTSSNFASSNFDSSNFDSFDRSIDRDASNKDQTSRSTSLVPDQSQSYTPHDYMHIDYPANITDYGIPGSGTPADPYIIEGYNFSTTSDVTYLVWLNHWVSNMIIRNNYFHGANYSYFGLDVDGQNITVENNIFVSNNLSIGIHTLYDDRGNITIKNNQIIDSRAIYVYFTDYVSIENNFIINSTGRTIYVWNSEYITIDNNTITNNLMESTIVLDTTSNVNITSNQQVNVGLYLDIAHNTTIDSNLIRTTTIDALYASSSENVTIANNHLIVLEHQSYITQGGFSIHFNTMRKNVYVQGNVLINYYFPIWSDVYSNITVLQNNIIPRYYSGTGRAILTVNIGSNISHNYWGDYTGPDEEMDGIIDEPLLTSHELLYDNYPMSEPYDYGLLEGYEFSDSITMHHRNVPEIRIELSQSREYRYAIHFTLSNSTYNSQIGVFVGTSITIPGNLTGPGLTNVSIFVYDLMGNLAVKHITINRIYDYDGPRITTPVVTISYINGTTGNELNFTLSDQYPDVYNVTLDSQVYVETTAWTNNSMYFINIDGLEVGQHTLEIHAYDQWGNIATQSIEIHVNRPEITHDDDESTPTVTVPSIGLVTPLLLLILAGRIRKNRE